MEPKNKSRIVIVVSIFLLITIFEYAEAKCIPYSDSFLAKSLIPLFPPENHPYKKESPASSENPLGKKDSPASSENPLAEKESPASSENPLAEKESPEPSRDLPPEEESPAPSRNLPHEKESAVPAHFPHFTLKPHLPLKPHFSSSSGVASPDIKNICSKTDFPRVCVSALDHPLKGIIKPTPLVILQNSITVSIECTKKALAMIEKLNASPDSPAALADCKDVYDEASFNLEEAVSAFKSRDMGKVNSMLSAAVSDFSTCGDGFEESGENNPVAALDDKLMKMASNCLAIASLVK